MLTTEGKAHIKRYLAGYSPVLAQSIAFGIGANAESVADRTLQLQTTQAIINQTTYDFATDKLIYKASIPDDYEGKVYEIGLYSLESPSESTEFGSRNITTFDSGSEDWVNDADETDAAFGTTNTRVGADSLLLAPAASTTLTYAMRELEIDLSGNSASDSFVFAFYSSTANTTSLKVRFLTDTSNYYEYDLGAQTSGYKFVNITKGSAVVTGVPEWESITQVHVIATAGAGGAAGIEMDAIRIEEDGTLNLDYVLVARKVLVTPVTKVDGMSQDIEFSLDVSL